MGGARRICGQLRGLFLKHALRVPGLPAAGCIRGSAARGRADGGSKAIDGSNARALRGIGAC